MKEVEIKLEKISNKNQKSGQLVLRKYQILPLDNNKKIPKKEPASNMNRGVFLEKLVSGIIGVMLLAILVI